MIWPQGTDTSAVSLTYLIWAVLSRPELGKQIEEDMATLSEGLMTMSKGQLFFFAAVEDAMRLYTAIPGERRGSLNLLLIVVILVNESFET